MNNTAKMLVFKTHKGLVQIEIDSISYCRSEGNYTRFFLENESSVCICRTIKTIETDLPGDCFIRIRNSLILPLARISSFSSKNRLVQIDNEYFRIARRRYAIVLNRLLKHKIPDKKINRLKKISTV